MTLTQKQQQGMLDNQVAAWVAELRRESARLADLISAATGKHHAVVMVSGTGDGYADVIPELILEGRAAHQPARLAGRLRYSTA